MRIGFCAMRRGQFVSAGFNWGEPLYALDTTHPDVTLWLVALMKQVRAWGFDYLKLDFLYGGALKGKRYQRHAARSRVPRMSANAARSNGRGRILPDLRHAHPALPSAYATRCELVPMLPTNGTTIATQSCSTTPPPQGQRTASAQRSTGCGSSRCCTSTPTWRILNQQKIR